MKVNGSSNDASGNEDRRQHVNDDSAFEFDFNERELHPQGSFLGQFSEFALVEIEYQGQKNKRLELTFISEDTNDAGENRSVNILARPDKIGPGTATWNALIAMGANTDELKQQLKSRQFRLSAWTGKKVAMNITHVPKKTDPSTLREEVGFFPAAELIAQRKKQASRARPNFAVDEDEPQAAAA